MRRAGRCTSSTASDHVCCVAAWRRDRRLGEQEALICQVSTRRWNVGFPTVHASFMRPGLRGSRSCCKFISCCRSASGPDGSGCEVGEWWWFENSRAYLYYFFIVNDCQFIVRSFASGREALKDGEVFVRCAFPYKAIVNFLVFESHMLAFCKVFLWRVRFWLRMNAGGVLNTCKSNGIHQALLGGESGERVSNA